MKLSSFSIVSQIVAAWSPGVNWVFNYGYGDSANYYAIQFEGTPAESTEVSETALYYGTESQNVSSGAI